MPPGPYHAPPRVPFRVPPRPGHTDACDGGGLVLTADEDTEELETKFAPLIEWLRETLDRFVDKVIISSHLTKSPCTLLASQYGATGNMERIMRAQAYQQGLDTQVQAWETMKKVRMARGTLGPSPCPCLSSPADRIHVSYATQKLEINVKHPVIQELLERVNSGRIGEDTVELANVLYDTAALRAGYSLRDNELIRFADRIDRIVRENLGVDLNAQVHLKKRYIRGRPEYRI